jgi:hypothetical protein
LELRRSGAGDCRNLARLVRHHVRALAGPGARTRPRTTSSLPRLPRAAPRAAYPRKGFSLRRVHAHLSAAY